MHACELDFREPYRALQEYVCAVPLPLEQQLGQGFGDALVLSSRQDHLQISKLQYLFCVILEACFVEISFYPFELFVIFRGILSQMTPYLRQLWDLFWRGKGKNSNFILAAAVNQIKTELCFRHDT